MVAKGQKVVSYSMKGGAPSDEELLKLIVGRSGTLRAPSLRRGKTLLVGFNQAAYEEVLG